MANEKRHPSRASGTFFSLRVEKGRRASERERERERFVEPNPLMLFGFGREKNVSVMRCVREGEREREHIFGR